MSADLDKMRSHAESSWKDLFTGDMPLICTGLSTCGISARAGTTQSTISDSLKELGIPARMMGVGCLGLCYAEPLVYIKNRSGPLICYGYISPEAAPSLVDKVLGHEEVDTDRSLGALTFPGQESLCGQPSIWDHPMVKPQVRVSTRNCGIIDPENLLHYLARGGYASLDKVLSMDPQAVIDEVKASGIRGRGGAGFPTGTKWELCRRSNGDEKYLICNADEGDPGAFMDRSVLEGDPHSVIEGMVIAAYAIGSTRGFIYCRAEYPLALRRLKIALDQARDSRLLGKNILGTGFDFDISIKEGAGAFVCGEETALMASIEGRRGMPSARPPFPANSGLWGKPTNINNVETLANLPVILQKGSAWYSSFGTGRSRGTKTLALAGAIRRTGLIEVPMDLTLREIIFNIGGGIVGDKTCKGVLTGGPSGGCIPASRLDLPVDYEALTEAGSIMGSGSMIIIDEDTCIVDLAKFFLTFTQRESCGKCTPCRIGTRQMLSILDRITRGEAGLQDLEKLENLAKAVRSGALCGLGAGAPNPVLTSLRYFRDEFVEHIQNHRCRSLSCRSLITIEVDPERCKGCDLCMEVCPAGAISGEHKSPHVIDKARCIRCGACIDACPDRFSAIKRRSPIEGVKLECA